MNLILVILGIIISLVLYLLLLALLLPKHYSVTVREVINQPKNVVYDYVRLFQNQPQYSEWLKTDPELKFEITGEDGTKGAILWWKSDNPDKNKNVGKGEQEIKMMDADKIEVELRLLEPMPATCKIVNSFLDKNNNSTEYECTFYAYTKFPVNLPSYLIGRRFISKTQQKTLNNIKHILEQNNR